MIGRRRLSADGAYADINAVNDRRDIVDIPGVESPGRPAPSNGKAGVGGAKPAGEARPWLGVYFRCCHVYSRMYRQPGSSRYLGNCPRCGAEVRATVGEGGTSQRMFFAE